LFKSPDIDKTKSVKMVVHVLKNEDEYIPALELIFPENGEDLTMEMLFAMREALQDGYRKIDKIIDTLYLNDE
jgi:hypothetical protein